MAICGLDYQQLINRQENVQFGAYFGGPLEYANEPHLHINWETSSKDIYENLRPIKSNLWTTDR